VRGSGWLVCSWLMPNMPLATCLGGPPEAGHDGVWVVRASAISSAVVNSSPLAPPVRHNAMLCSAALPPPLRHGPAWPGHPVGLAVMCVCALLEPVWVARLKRAMTDRR